MKSTNIYFFIYKNSEVKVYSSETEAALTVEKPINLVDSILKSVYELNQCFKNNDFVSYTFMYCIFIYLSSRHLFVRFSAFATFRRWITEIVFQIEVFIFIADTREENWWK